MLKLIINIILTTMCMTIFGYAFAENATFSFGEQEITKPYIYKVTALNGTKSFIFGSMHHGIGVEQLPYWVQRLHQRAEIHGYELMAVDFSYYEASQNLKNNPVAAIEAIGLRMDTPEFSEQEIEKLVIAGIPREVARVMSNKSCGKFIYRNHYFAQTFRSLDYEFMLYSLKFNRPILELEDDLIREQAAKLVAPPGCSVKDIIHDPETIALLDMLARDNEKIYLSGIEPSDDEYNEDDEDLFYRNRAWMKKLVPVLNAKQGFITFGVNHLFGKEGVINLLKKRGFLVERVYSDPGGSFGTNHDFQR